MKDSELRLDRTCHVLYSKPCKAQIQEKIALHYPPEQREDVWERVQRQYVDFFTDWSTDLGGKRNFHNGPGGNYDCVAPMAYYVVCREVTSLAEIEAMEGELFLPSFRRLSRFVDCNKPLFKRLMYRAFRIAKKQCDKWGDFRMDLAPFDKGKPLYYEFTEHPRRLGRQVHQLFHKMFHGTPHFYTLGGICILHPCGYALSRRKADPPACFFLFNSMARVSPCWRTAPRLS